MRATADFRPAHRNIEREDTKSERLTVTTVTMI